MGLFHAAGPGQAFDVPERARGERAFGAGQAVDGVVVIVIAINHAVAHQVLFDGIEGGQPAWVLGADETHQWHQQHRAVEGGAADVLDEMPAFLVPEIFPDIGIDGLPRLVPTGERGGQGAFRGEADRPVQRHPAHQARMQEMMLLAAHFPDADIALLPGFADLIDHFYRVLPPFVGNGFAVLVDQVHRVHQLAEDIQLHLRIRQIADAHRSCTTMAGQVCEFDFRQFLTAVDAIQDIEFHRVAPTVTDPPAQPAHVGVGLVDETQAHEGVNGERGVADPGVAIVPVAFAANAFRQAEGRGGEDGAVFARGEQLHRQCRAIDHFPPATAIAGLPDPVAPELQGALQTQIGGALPEARIVDGAEQKLGGLILFEGEFGDRHVAVDP